MICVKGHFVSKTIPPFLGKNIGYDESRKMEGRTVTNVQTMLKLEARIYKDGLMTKWDLTRAGVNVRTIQAALPLMVRFGRLTEIKGYRTSLYDLTQIARAMWDKETEEALEAARQQKEAKRKLSSDTHSPIATQSV